MIIWYILCSFGTIFGFWYYIQRKIWQPCVTSGSKIPQKHNIVLAENFSKFQMSNFSAHDDLSHAGSVPEWSEQEVKGQRPPDSRFRTPPVIFPLPGQLKKKDDDDERQVRSYALLYVHGYTKLDFCCCTTTFWSYLQQHFGRTRTFLSYDNILVIPITTFWLYVQ
jgi:hypothetical protein